MPLGRIPTGIAAMDVNPRQPGRTIVGYIKPEGSYDSGITHARVGAMASQFLGMFFKKRNRLIEQAYDSPMAQGQRLRKNVGWNMLALARGVFSPDLQSQNETGYTVPLQEFGFQSDLLWNSPSGRSVLNTGNAGNQPQVKSPTPTISIPVKMPWNR